MKPLLFVVPALPDPPTTGGEIYNRRLVEGLRESFELTVVTLGDLGVSMDVTADEFSRRLMALVARGAAPGPVLIDTYLYPIAGPATEALRRSGFGPVVGFGQAWYPGRYRSFLARHRVRRGLASFLRQCDHHVVVSEAMKAETARAGIPAQRIDTVLPGFELAERLPELGARRPGPLRVRTAGTYMEAKGQHLLVEAVERLAARDPNLFATLTVEAIGVKSQAPDFVRGLEQRAQRLPPGLLRLSGPLPQPELWRAFADTDVFVFPAIGEGLGMVVVEAMLCGAVPVVSPDGPLREIVGESDAGFVVPRKAEAIARTVRDLSRDPRFEERRQAARRRALALAPTWAQTVDRVASAINRVAERRAA